MILSHWMIRHVSCLCLLCLFGFGLCPAECPCLLQTRCCIVSPELKCRPKWWVKFLMSTMKISGERWTLHCTWHKPRSCTSEPLHPAVPAEGLYGPGVECWGFPGWCLLSSGPRWSDSAAAAVWSEECCQNHFRRITEERLLMGCSPVKTHYWHVCTSLGAFKIHTWKSGTRLNINNPHNHWGSSCWCPQSLDLDNVHHRLLSLVVLVNENHFFNIMKCFCKRNWLISVECRLLADDFTDKNRSLLKSSYHPKLYGSCYYHDFNLYVHRDHRIKFWAAAVPCCGYNITHIGHERLKTTTDRQESSSIPSANLTSFSSHSSGVESDTETLQR